MRDSVTLPCRLFVGTAQTGHARGQGGKPVLICGYRPRAAERLLCYTPIPRRRHEPILRDLDGRYRFLVANYRPWEARLVYWALLVAATVAPLVALVIWLRRMFG
jgi:hypothetical protein